jgi:phage-related minor tail protein
MSSAFFEGKNAMEAFNEAGKRAIQELTQELLKMFALRPIKELILAGAGGGLTAGAKGLVFNQGTVTPFATGGVIKQPTLAPMALMGESGPEAVLPLRRGSGGKLGVSVAMGDSDVNVMVNIQNNSTAKVEAKRGTDSQGRPRVDILIRDVVRDVLRGDLASGTGMAADLERSYGLDRTRSMG